MENKRTNAAIAESVRAEANFCPANPFDQKNGNKSKKKIYAQHTEI